MANGLSVRTANEIDAELGRARKAFPTTAHMTVALVEEVGEVARALLQGKPAGELRRECIQVAVMAIRVMEEGDADFGREAGGKLPAKAGQGGKRGRR